MTDDSTYTAVLASISGVTVYAAHHLLAGGLHTEVPLDDVTQSVGAALAVLAFLGVFINDFAWEMHHES